MEDVGIRVFTCGPQTEKCDCHCPDGECGHDWNGDVVKYDRGESVTCSVCGMVAAEHDLWVGP